MHLDRLESSATYFDIPFDRPTIQSQITTATNQLPQEESHRIRLLLDSSGDLTLTSEKLSPESAATKLSVRLSPTHTNSTDVFLRHKTTNREQYNTDYAQARAEGFDEVIYINERGEITEGAISNIFIQRDGKLLTPPLTSGVLPGIYRRHLLETDPTAEERTLTTQDLETAEAVFLCNALRGLRKVTHLSLEAR
jgi:para-aminobenzoate synthetase/4-amino-4-deoxychorismate lyase